MKNFTKKSIFIVALATSANIFCMQRFLNEQETANLCTEQFNAALISMQACASVMQNNDDLLKNEAVCNGHIKVIGEATTLINGAAHRFPQNETIQSCLRETHVWLKKAQQWQTYSEDMKQERKKKETKTSITNQIGMSEWCG